jgi:hypothetical protein
MSEAILARANGLICKEEIADINTMVPTLSPIQFYNQASYRIMPSEFESLSIPPLICSLIL